MAVVDRRVPAIRRWALWSCVLLRTVGPGASSQPLGPRGPINDQGERVARTVRIVSRCTITRNLQRLKNRVYDLASWPGVNRVADKSPTTPFSSSSTEHKARRYISLCVPTRSPNSGHYLYAARVNVIPNRRDRARVVSPRSPRWWLQLTRPRHSRISIRCRLSLYQKYFAQKAATGRLQLSFLKLKRRSFKPEVR